MSLDANTAIRNLNRNRLSSVMIVEILKEFARETPAELPRFVAELKKDALVQVIHILNWYPQTDFGWSIIPQSREDLLRPDLNAREKRDLESCLFGEDRPCVEQLRTLVQDRITELRIM